MKGIVVYFSRWGNCKKVAEAIYNGIKDSSHDVSLSAVGSLDGLEKDLDFMVIGSPTRAGKAAGPIRRFIKREVVESSEKVDFAAFGTGLASVIKKDATMSADNIYKILKDTMREPIAPPFRATVKGMRGPLADGEVQRALEFGKKLGQLLGEKSQ